MHHFRGEYNVTHLPDVYQLARENAGWIRDLRRELHRCPEIGFDLPRTSAIVRRALTELGVSYRAGIAECGVVATIGHGEPCVALRADMDALAVHEEADVDFRSDTPGRMHACGHDCHTAMLLGAAKILKAMEPDLRGTVKLIFQPAEEGGGGADRMVREGVLDNPHVERIFGLHVWPFAPTGVVCGCAGPFMAAGSSFHIIVRGQGGHGAFPHVCRDPNLAAAHLTIALQSIISRETNPVAPAVVSVVSINSHDPGVTFNVIPDVVELRGTFRSLNLNTLEQMRTSIERIAVQIAAAFRCTATVERGTDELDYPPTSNDPDCWRQVQEIAGELVTPQNVKTVDPVMGAEDFSFYTTRTAACFVGLGVYNASIQATESVHSPRFKVDEGALPLGTALHVGFALRSLEDRHASR